MNLMLVLFNRMILNYAAPSDWLPIITIVLNGPVLNFGQRQYSEFFHEQYREVGLTFPLHLIFHKSDVSVSFSIACGLSFSITYQWDY